MYKNKTDLDCVQMISRGGKAREEGVSILYHNYQLLITRFFMKKGQTREQAEDLLQEVFIKVVRNIGSYRADGAFKSWIMMIARNVLNDQYRKPHNKQVYEDIDDSVEAEERTAIPAFDPSEKEFAECVRNAFNTFSEKNKDRSYALRLWSLSERTIEEMATFLGKTPANTRQYLYESRIKFKDFVTHCHVLLKS